MPGAILRRGAALCAFAAVLASLPAAEAAASADRGKREVRATVKDRCAQPSKHRRSSGKRAKRRCAVRAGRAEGRPPEAGRDVQGSGGRRHGERHAVRERMRGHGRRQGRRGPRGVPGGRSHAQRRAQRALQLLLGHHDGGGRARTC